MRHPAAREAREREAREPEVEVLLHARRVQDRDAAVDQRVLGLVRDRRRLRARVVAAEREHAAVRRGAGVVAVLDRVAGAIDARPLAVPDREHAVVLRARVQVRLLRAPDRRRGEVLVHARLEAHVVLLEVLARLPEREVVGAERRAAVAGDEAGGVQARREVALALEQRQPHQRLHARQVDAPALPRVAVLELVGGVEGGGAQARLSGVGGADAELKHVLIPKASLGTARRYRAGARVATNCPREDRRHDPRHRPRHGRAGARARGRGARLPLALRARAHAHPGEPAGRRRPPATPSWPRSTSAAPIRWSRSRRRRP